MTSPARCPKGSACASCTRNTADLAVVTLATSSGVICLTQCAECLAKGWAPPWTMPHVVQRAEAHRRHLNPKGAT